MERVIFHAKNLNNGLWREEERDIAFVVRFDVETLRLEIDPMIGPVDVSRYDSGGIGIEQNKDRDPFPFIQFKEE